MIAVKIHTRPSRVLDFDIETVAAGFADPNWVPQKITCVAWSWIGADRIQSTICGPEGIFGQPRRRRKMLEPLLEALGEADMVTGHNIARFDLPVIHAELMRLDMESLPPLLVQDTMWLRRSKGFKKGLDNLGALWDVPTQKMSLDWQGWQDAYDQKGWKTIRDRAESDVEMHKQVREVLLDRGYLKPPRRWNP